MKVCIAIFLLGLALAADDTVPAKVLDWDENRANCRPGYSLVSCECSPADACQAVAVRPEVDGSGLCNAEPKPGRRATAKGVCRKGVKQRMAVSYTENKVDCPASYAVSQCLAYRSSKAPSDFRVQETEQVGNGCVVKGAVSEDDKNRQLYLQAICVAE